MPKAPPPPPRFVTEIPSRASASGGTYKHHRHIGHAKNAVTSRSHYRSGGRVYGPAKIYEWNFQADQWDLIYDIPAGTREEDLPWKAKG